MKKIFILVALVSILSTPLFSFDVDVFVKKAVENDDFIEPEAASFMTDETIIKYDGDFEEEVGKKVSKQKCTIKDNGEVDIEIIEEEVFGVFDDEENENEESGEETETEMESMGTGDDGFPFSEKGYTSYNFKYLGTANLDGKETYKIEFEPKKKSRDMIEGIAYFTASDSLFRKIDFTMSKGIPGVKHFEMSLGFDYQGKYRIPKSIWMKMRIKIILLADEAIELTQNLYDYKIVE